MFDLYPDIISIITLFLDVKSIIFFLITSGYNWKVYLSFINWNECIKNDNSILQCTYLRKRLINNVLNQNQILHSLNKLFKSISLNIFNNFKGDVINLNEVGVYYNQCGYCLFTDNTIKWETIENNLYSKFKKYQNIDIPYKNDIIYNYSLSIEHLINMNDSHTIMYIIGTPTNMICQTNYHDFFIINTENIKESLLNININTYTTKINIDNLLLSRLSMIEIIHYDYPYIVVSGYPVMSSQFNSKVFTVWNISKNQSQLNYKDSNYDFMIQKFNDIWMYDAISFEAPNIFFLFGKNIYKYNYKTQKLSSFYELYSKPIQYPSLQRITQIYVSLYKKIIGIYINNEWELYCLTTHKNVFTLPIRHSSIYIHPIYDILVCNRRIGDKLLQYIYHDS